MSEPFIGEVRMWGFNWAPRYWASCDGQVMQISQNQTLYAVLGTAFGGNGVTTFNLPDLRGRAPLHNGGAYYRGSYGGQEQVTIAENTMAAHTHGFNATTESADQLNVSTAGTNLLATTNPSTSLYGSAQSMVDMNTGTCSETGGGGSHVNIQPTIAVGFCIAIQGLFPSRN